MGLTVFFIVLVISVVALSILFGIAGLAWTILLLVIHGILYILKHFFVFIVAIAVILTAILESLGAAFGVFIFLVLLLIVANSVIE